MAFWLQNITQNCFAKQKYLLFSPPQELMHPSQYSLRNLGPFQGNKKKLFQEAEKQ